MGIRCRIERVSAVPVLMAVFAATAAWGQPAGPHHGFLGGPWEVLAKMGHEGGAVRLPLSVADENKPQEMKAILPVMATPIGIRIKRYVPDLKWDTTVVSDPNGGSVAKLSLRGENLQQDLWLSTRDRERQAISSHVGSVAIRELPAVAGAVTVLEKLTDPKTVGILLVWLGDADAPFACAVQPGASVTLPGSPWKLAVSQYVPHYSIDRETKKVTNLSDEPVNPAIEIQVEGGGREYRQWLWSQFPSAPHQGQSLPFRARFLDFDLGRAAGRYILAVVRQGPSYLLCATEGKKRLERVESGKRYPFGDDGYSFAVEDVKSAARIDITWKNNSEVLLHPALVADIVHGDRTQEVVLELGKPYHHKTPLGTLVVLYRRVP